MATLQPGHAWAIRQFHERFTFSQAERVKTWSRLPVPINLNGPRYKALVESDDGAVAYGVFIALAALAANCRPRGVLSDDEGPLSIRSIASRINQPSARVEQALDLLTEPDIGWIIQVPIQEDTRGRSEHARSALGASSERARSALGARSETDQTRPDQSRPEEIRKPARDEQGAGGNARAVALAGWLAGADPRAILAGKGIRDPALSALAAVCTPEEIDRETRRLRADPTIRNLPGALIHRLVQAHGIELDLRGGPAAAIDGAVREAAERLARLRQTHVKEPA